MRSLDLDGDVDNGDDGKGGYREQGQRVDPGQEERRQGREQVADGVGQIGRVLLKRKKKSGTYRTQYFFTSM